MNFYILEHIIFMVSPDIVGGFLEFDMFKKIWKMKIGDFFNI